MVKSGQIYSFGMGFWGANGHDGIWHLALINSLIRDLASHQAFSVPVFSGFLIKNYHLGFDLLVAFLFNITKVPVVNLYFQILPPIFALLTGLTVYLFVLNWKKSSSAALFATFFVYFGGDMSWVFGKGESTFWSQQSISTLINPPFVLSLILIFLGLMLIVKKDKSLFENIACVIIFGVLLETKAYAGVLVLISLFLAGIWGYVKNNRIDIFFISLFSFALTLVLFLTLNKGSENLFLFQPFWFLQTLFNLDRFSIPKLASAITNYNLAHNWLKLIPAYIFGFIVFWIGNMWTRLIKESEVIKWLRHPSSITSLDVFITSVIIGGALAPMLFVQKGTPWNTIQFFYYSLVFSGILAGIAIPNLLQKIKTPALRSLLIIFIVLLTMPTTLKTLSEVYLPSRPPAMLNNDELFALNFLSKLPSGIVLTYPFDQGLANKAVDNPPRPLYLYDSTAYVSAFSNHPAFLEDQVNLDITNFDWRARRAEVFNNFLNTLNQTQARTFLRENSIKYVYWVKPQRAKLGESQLGLTKIFENDKVDIFKVE